MTLYYLLLAFCSVAKIYEFYGFEKKKNEAIRQLKGLQVKPKFKLVKT